MRMENGVRRAFWASTMERVSHAREVVPLLKIELRATINSLDDFVESNHVVIDAALLAGTLSDWIRNSRVIINAAFPEPSRSLLTASQKDYLLRAVIRMDANDGS